MNSIFDQVLFAPRKIKGIFDPPRSTKIGDLRGAPYVVFVTVKPRTSRADNESLHILNEVASIGEKRLSEAGKDRIYPQA
jgi:hypothetical protein